MAGGKYTTFAPESNAKNNLLSKLFPASPTAKFVGKEVDYRGSVVALATAKVDAKGVGGMLPSDGVQQGDMTMIGQVKLDFGAAPDVTKVVWTQAGGPANAYVPDITSPGPGKTDGVDKTNDPGIATTDLPGKDGYVPGGPATGTRNPLPKSKSVYASNVNALSTSGIPGDSGANG